MILIGNIEFQYDSPQSKLKNDLKESLRTLRELKRPYEFEPSEANFQYDEESLYLNQTKDWKDLVKEKPLTWQIASHEAQSRLLKEKNAQEVSCWLTKSLLNENENKRKVINR